MKKIISICSLIVVAALVVTVFTACGSDKKTDKNKNKNTTTTVADLHNSENSSVVIGELTLKVNESNAEVFNNGKLFQTLSFPEGKATPFSYDYAKDHYDFVDLNFDGNLDVYIAVADDDGVIYFYCWLYNATKKTFDYSIALSALTNISVDSAEQFLYAIGYDNDGNKVVSKYTFENGSLKFVESFNESDEIPENVDQNVNNNTIGDKPNTGKPSTGDTTTPSGSTGETKPPLTTQPNSDGIILVDPTDEVWY